MLTPRYRNDRVRTAMIFIGVLAGALAVAVLLGFILVFDPTTAAASYVPTPGPETTPPPVPDHGRLAGTGADALSFGWSIAAGIVLAVGFVMWFVGRRRTS